MMNSRRTNHYKKLIALHLLVLGIILGFAPGMRFLLMDTNKCLEKFLTQNTPSGSSVAEDAMMDPLIIAGDRILPLVITKVKNVSMNNRRYAISFLGNCRDFAAIPELSAIALNDSEELLIRRDALLAVLAIDRHTGTQLAIDCSNDLATSDSLEEASLQFLQLCNEVSSGKDIAAPRRRSFIEAFFGLHN